MTHIGRAHACKASCPEVARGAAPGGASRRSGASRRRIARLGWSASHEGKSARARVVAHDALLEAVALPTAGIVSAAAVAFAALRAYTYAQRTYVEAAMLSRQLLPGKTVIQLGGGVRELFLYPKGTIQVKVVDESANSTVLEQAAIQTGIPVVSQKEGPDSLVSEGGAAADAVVCMKSLHKVSDLAGFLTTVQRVLKPGGRFIFIQPVSSGPSPELLQQLSGSADICVPYAKFQSLRPGSAFETFDWNIAMPNVDPHIVGLGIKKKK